jgi:hypothetical protein
MAEKPRAVFVIPDEDAPTNEPIDEEAAEREQLNRDIAVRVARVLLGTALQEEVCELGELDGLSLVILPSMEWSRPVRDAIKLGAPSGKGPTHVRAGQPFSKRTEPGWAFIEISGRVGCEAPARIAIALSQGLSVVAVAAAADRERLPHGLEGAADRVLVLGSPDWVSLAVAAMEGNRIIRVDWEAVRHDEGLLDGLTPSVLGMCYRPSQTVEEFCSRLARALKADTANRVATTAGPHGLVRVPGLPSDVEGWARCLVRDLALYKRGSLPWSAMDRGAVLAGPPGTGKSTLARALAEEAGVSLVVGSYAEWQGAKDGHLGSTLSAMRATFERARAAAPCILLIDEVDSFPNRAQVRHDYKDYMRSVVNALLQELDGPSPREGVVVVGTCNQADLLDPALVRPGRLERVLVLGPPDGDALEAILRVHLGRELVDQPLADVAALAEGMTGAEVEMSVRAARRSARVLGRAMQRGDLLLSIADARGLELAAPMAMIH